MKELSPQISPTERVAVAKKREKGPYSDKILIVDGLQDPGNLGTLIRSAVAFNFKTIISSFETVDFYNEKTVSATQGNIFYANIIKNDLSNEIKDLKEKGYQIVATDLIKGVKIKTFKTKEKVCLILGSEARGIKEEISQLADNFVKIETDSVESLNVSVAGSIIMYEMSDNND